MTSANPARDLNKALQFCAVLDYRIGKIQQSPNICPTTVTIERVLFQQKRVPALADNSIAQYFLGCIHDNADLNRALKIKTRIDRMNDTQTKSFGLFVENLTAEIQSTKTIAPHKAFGLLEAELTKQHYILSAKQQPANDKIHACPAA